MVREELFGKDTKIIKALNEAKELAYTNLPILISGEHGVGKQTLAIYMHQLSSRKEAAYMIVDCSRSEKEVEDEILGHRDETNGRYNKGVLERANGGTIILRNVDNLGDDFQKKIHKIFLELSDYDIDLRIISTTTKNISKLVGAGRFSRALYLYISGNQIHLVPLRERKEDIRWLAQNFLEIFAMDKISNENNTIKNIAEKLSNELSVDLTEKLVGEFVGSIEEKLSDKFVDNFVDYSTQDFTNELMFNGSTDTSLLLNEEFSQGSRTMAIPSFTSAAYEKLMNYYWAGNILELKNAVINSLENVNEGIIDVDELSIGEKKNLMMGGLDEDGIRLMSLKEAEKLLIKKALIHTSENRTQAAKILGVSIRTLRNKINEYRNDGSNYFVNLR
ncbi:MAG: sigma-54-dependent Fis family transcriptional regulator [Oligoflexia bacterium]|nr:sigma-54-dependent Fis family transcriptional regulator [Oligoflexia bacterium]